jgi:ABC-type branched-subunit amino acid transport system ATPase component
MAIVLVEQHTDFALSAAARALVIERGRTAWQGESSALAANERLLERYVGLRVDHG